MNTIYNNLCYDKNNNQLIGNTTVRKVKFSELNLENKTDTKFDTILLFQNRFDNNFRHFMIETFYLLSFLFTSNFTKNYNENNFKILINKNYYRHSYEILEILGFTKYIHFMENGIIYRANNLIWSNKKVNYKNINYKKLVEKIIYSSKKTSSIECFEKIYLSREHVDIFTENNTPKRWITNQKEVVEIISKYDYQKVRVDNLHMRDQINLINSAKKIITFIGAGCENIAFTSKNSLFTIIYADNQKWWNNCYKYSNSHYGIECLKKDRNIFYNPKWGGNDPFNGPYNANLDYLEKKLK